MDRELVKEIINYEGQSSCLVLATIIATEGSSPRKTGAQMLIFPRGNISGSIGGGSVEADIIKKGKVIIKNGSMKNKIKKYCYDMSNKEAAQVGGVCGGSVEILLETIDVGE